MLGILWNVAYDSVFRLPLPDGVTVIRYADDNLVVSEEARCRSWRTELTRPWPQSRVILGTWGCGLPLKKRRPWFSRPSTARPYVPVQNSKGGNRGMRRLRSGDGQCRARLLLVRQVVVAEER
ncbi:Reverse transcriptase domain-containing protein, partial [Aphis craccivora]